MAQKYRYLLFIIPILLLGMACSLGQVAANVGEQVADLERGSGNVVTKELTIDSFSRLELAGIGEVEIEYGRSYGF